ncbi:glycerophosphodiester phosphodiesterase [uncultured Clostridium sp.]|uniref:glycerophosphodiester phosphodiesterase n=1 Tax=uncultured Clostridium sp. TaxID=59620 RepID=UPI0025E6E8DD|nr:glycerophosphodiester phosphodiesterase [uncultured Clostridium sp.]
MIMIKEDRINITAHAGCMNTKMDSIESVESGIKNGADIIEIDLNIKDGRLILSHDIPKDNMEYEKFEKVLDIMNKYGNAELNIDVKDVSVLEALKDMILKYELMDRIFLTGLTYENISDNKEKLYGFRYLVNLDESDLKRIFISGNSRNLDDFGLKKISDSKAIGVNLNYKLISSDIEIAEEFRKRDFQVHVWTVDKLEDMKKLLKYNINSITTNKVDLLKECINSYCQYK